jgi:uncharacterized integral membrane protein
MFGLPDVPFELVFLSPLGLGLFFSLWGSIIFMFILMIKTPALSFLKASFGKNVMILNPSEDRYLRFKPAKKEGSLLHIKDQGYYLSDPNDMYFEKVSKVPMTLAFGLHAIPINSEMAAAVKQLETLGIKNNEDLNQFLDEVAADFEKWKKNNPTAKPEEYPFPYINVLGRTVPLDKIHNYFNRNDRADLIEAEVNRRTSAESLKKVEGNSNASKWIIAFGILIFCGMLGLAIYNSTVTKGNSVDINQLKDLLAPLKVVSIATTTTAPNPTAIT